MNQSQSAPTPTDVRVVVLGASTKGERYANQAVGELVRHGYADTVPVHPSGRAVHGKETRTSLSEVDGPVHTITVYLSATNSTPLIDDLLALHPRRVVLNPGAENAALKQRAEAEGVEVVEACTLVMLNLGQF